VVYGTETGRPSCKPIVTRDVFLVLLLLNQRAVGVTKMTMTHGEDETPEDVVVLTGEHNGLDWKVVATWEPRSDPVEGRELLTMLHGFEGTKQVIGSGFGGPALYPGQVVHEWRGCTDQWPYFVMARADPTVDRIVAVTDRGIEVELSRLRLFPSSGCGSRLQVSPPERHPTGSSSRWGDRRSLTFTGRCTGRSPTAKKKAHRFSESVGKI